MSKWIQALHSKTVWTIILLVAYNILAAYGSALSPQLNVLVNAVLGALAAYFRVTATNIPTAVTPPVTGQA
jgi:hypothetical protein